MARQYSQILQRACVCVCVGSPQHTITAAVCVHIHSLLCGFMLHNPETISLKCFDEIVKITKTFKAPASEVIADFSLKLFLSTWHKNSDFIVFNLL